MIFDRQRQDMETAFHFEPCVPLYKTPSAACSQEFGCSELQSDEDFAHWLHMQNCCTEALSLL